LQLKIMLLQTGIAMAQNALSAGGSRKYNQNLRPDFSGLSILF
jgi:hypothetical protein